MGDYHRRGRLEIDVREIRHFREMRVRVAEDLASAAMNDDGKAEAAARRDDAFDPFLPLGSGQIDSR